MLVSNIKNGIKEYNKDSVFLSYEDINSSGFPFSWKIIISNPKFSVSNLQLRIPSSKTFEVNLDKIIISLKYNFKDLSIDFDKNIQISEIENDKITNYSLNSNHNLQLNLATEQRFYFDNRFLDFFLNINKIQLKNNNFDYSYKDEKLFSIHKLILDFNKTKSNKNLNELYKINLAFDYKSFNNMLDYGNDSKLKISMSNNFEYYKSLKDNQENKSLFKKFNSKIDDLYIKINDYFMEAKGEIELDDESKDLLSSLDLQINYNNYESVLTRLLYKEQLDYLLDAASLIINKGATTSDCSIQNSHKCIRLNYPGYRASLLPIFN